MTMTRTDRSIRPTAGLTVVATLALSVLGACGGDGDNAGTGSDTAGAGATVDAASAAECLDAAGFDVTREADQDPARVLPEAYKESVGLIEGIELGFIGDAKGTGSVDIYESSDEAAQADADGASMRTEDVLAGHVGNAAYDYIVTAGDDPGVVAAIEGCLG